MDEVFWFFFSKKNKRFFLKKEAKTFIHYSFARTIGSRGTQGPLAASLGFLEVGGGDGAVEGGAQVPGGFEA